MINKHGFRSEQYKVQSESTTRRIKQLLAKQQELRTKAEMGIERINIIFDINRKQLEKKIPEALTTGWRELSTQVAEYIAPTKTTNARKGRDSTR